MKAVLPTLSIVIPSHRREKSLLELLSSIETQRLPTEVSIQILVAFNEASDPALSKIKDKYSHLQNLEICVADRIGANSARNKGLSLARATYVLFLDDDCSLPHENFLESLLKTFLQNPEATAVGGFYESSPQTSSLDAFYNQVCNEWLLRSRFSENWCGNLLGGNVCYRKDFLTERNCRFDESQIYGGTETRFHADLAKQGARFYLSPELSVSHRPRLTLWKLHQKVKRQGKAHLEESGATPLPLETGRATDLPVRFSKNHFYRFFYRQAFQRGAKPGSEPKKTFEQKLQRLKTDLGQLWTHLQIKDLPANPDYPEFAYFITSDSKSNEAHLKILNSYIFKKIYIPLQDKKFWEEKLKGHPASLHCYLDLRWKYNEVHLPSSEHGPLLIILSKDQFSDGLDLQRNFPGCDFSFAYDLSRGAPIEPQKDWLYFWDDALPLQTSDIFSRLEELRKTGQLQTFPAFLVGDWQYGTALRPEDFYPLPSETVELGAQCLSPRLSIVIPCKDRDDELLAVLEKLNHNTASFEVIVVDDGSKIPLTESLLPKLPKALNYSLQFVRWERKLSSGFVDSRFRAGLARNLGASKAQSQNLCFLDSDILVTPDFVKSLISQLQAPRKLLQAKRLMLTEAASQGRLDLNRVSIERDCYSEDFYWENFKSQKTWEALHLPWKYTCTYSLALQREDFWRAGGFNPKFSIYGFEDVDLGYRLSRQGLSLEFMNSSVFHLYPSHQHFNYHFDADARWQTLRKSCRSFYLQHLDPQIFLTFYSFIGVETGLPSNKFFRLFFRLWYFTKYQIESFSRDPSTNSFSFYILRKIWWKMKNRIGLRSFGDQ